MPPKAKDLTGAKFKRLLVIKRNGYLSSGKRPVIAWLCRCECGRILTVRGKDLKDGHTKSCGCFNAEQRKLRIKHGMYQHPLYKVWLDMKGRCNLNITREDYKKHYVKRGIVICNKWENSFQEFYKWAENKWKRGLQLDRKNNNRGYNPKNCRFITGRANKQNTNQSKRWFISGVKYNSSGDAAKAIGVDRATIRCWCNGKQQGKYYYPPKKECYAINLY